MSNGVTKVMVENTSSGSKSKMPKIRQSPFKTIRNSFLMKKNGLSNTLNRSSHTPKVSGSKDNNEGGGQESHSGSIYGGCSSPADYRNIKKNRSVSTERVTLFKYDHVKVTSYQSPLPSLYERTSTARTTEDIHGRKATVLEAKGPLEIYQLVAPMTAQSSQKVTYLCLGRKEQIIRPILPKLKINMLNSEGYQFSVLSFNPENWWKVEFLESTGDDSVVPYTVISAFENAVKNICQFFNKSARQIKDFETENDDLEYLLYIDSKDKDGGHDEVTLDRDNSTDDTSVLNTATTSEMINDAFKRAMENILPNNPVQRLDLQKFRKFGSHNELADTLVTDTYEKHRSRALSVPYELPLWNKRSNDSTLVSWMDIEYDDIIKE
ncbi:Inp1p Ecym_2115 [Eremothecium cymbalariae DBVPG|uniref:Inheritance of peroxisomes protein 1 n=1 Tax=Eremothecium cymbalariae (strain CBS 270.75 / DBVPG 7215 / KCTC 17166 / NRRL Y-17582) TaxID=931890 RepID=G8JPL9_ERECY|nr:Hypothetical protein Ecym_2115 [Eremothecium cymbalariae DBVPG\